MPPKKIKKTYTLYLTNPDIKRYYSHRIQRVVLPYLVISVVFNLLLDVAIQRDFLLFVRDVSCISFWAEGRGAWYVAWIIPIYIIYPLYAKFTHKKSWVSIVVAVLFVLLIAIVGIPSRFQSAAGATIAFFCGDFAGKHVKEDNPRVIYIMLLSILIAPLYILRIVSGQAVYVCFFALVGIGLCALFSIIIKCFPVWLNKGLKVIGKVSLECYLFNIYLISVARIILGDRINTNMGVFTYLVVIIVGIFLSCLMGNIEDRCLKK